MRDKKTIVFLGDGMADEAVPELGGRTPLQYAHTPGMDAIAREGVTGLLSTLQPDLPTSSEVANMSVLGCDVRREYCGRGPLEAIGRNIPLADEDVAFRLNLTSVSEGILQDYSAGHIKQSDAAEVIRTLNENFGTSKVTFHPGLSYRNILVLSGPEFSPDIETQKPDDHQGDPIINNMPVARGGAGTVAASFLAELMTKATPVLEACPVNRRLKEKGRPMANGVWPWSGGYRPRLQTLQDKYGICSAVISAVDVILGLGQCLGMDVLHVPGATGYTDTNYEGKADAAVRALETHDFVYLHLEAIDEMSHERNLSGKVSAIEAFDARIISPVLAAIDPRVTVAVLPDHPVPLRLGRHTRDPVPVAIRMAGQRPDAVRSFDEIACRNGALGLLKDQAFMRRLLS